MIFIYYFHTCIFRKIWNVGHFTSLSCSVAETVGLLYIPSWCELLPPLEKEQKEKEGHNFQKERIQERKDDTAATNT